MSNTVQKGWPRSYYLAKEGDTLETIASKYGVSLESLQALNPHLNNSLRCSPAVVWLPRGRKAS